METQMFDNVKFEKEKAVARFNRFHRIVKLWQFFEVLVVFCVISLCSARAPAVFKVSGAYFVEFSTYLFNHHVVFVIGNAIIVLLFMLCRQNDAAISGGGGRDFYDDYEKYSEAAKPAGERTLSPQPYTEDAPATEFCSGGHEKQIVVRDEEAEPISQCDEVAVAIYEATRLIKRFQRTQSETLKREIAVRPRPELRRSETENCRKSKSSESVEASDIENLSSEEFRRRVDAFIDQHWSKKTTKLHQFEEHENYQLRLQKMA